MFFYVPVLYVHVSEIILLPSKHWACLIDLPQYLAVYHITRLLYLLKLNILYKLLSQSYMLIIPWGSLSITRRELLIC